MPLPPSNDHVKWWESLLKENEVNQKDTSCDSGSEETHISGLSGEEMNAAAVQVGVTKVGDLGFNEEGHIWGSNFCFDVGLWDLFDTHVNIP